MAPTTHISIKDIKCNKVSCLLKLKESIKQHQQQQLHQHFYPISWQHGQNYPPKSITYQPLLIIKNTLHIFIIQHKVQ